MSQNLKYTIAYGLGEHPRDYDAWGRPRNPVTLNYTAANPFTHSLNTAIITSRGYTFHEHIFEFSLINMNARMYDPVTRRVISPDNYIQAPDNTQSFNRYSYCWNNPLKYTDPTGEIVWVIPTIGWSKQGGLSVGVSVGVGIPGGLSAQTGVGYNFKSNDAYGYVGATFAL
ncbi:MAG: RHS repeat-associated core domain-containing protein, partial [Bacteroidota bacterium]